MVTDHVCVPGLDQPVTVSEYAALEGLTEAQVLSFIHDFNIRDAKYFRGQWFIEAPPNSEARLAQLRRGTPAPTRTPTPRREPNESERNIAPVAPKPPPTAALPSAPARRPQPVDYGLKFDDLNLYAWTWGSRTWMCRLDDGNVIRCLGPRDDDEYKKGRRWFCILHPWKARADNAGGFAVMAFLIGGVATANHRSSTGLLIGLSLLGFGLLCVLFAIIPGVLLKRLRTDASPALEAYWQALHKYDDGKRAAEKAAREAARDAELRKRSYWTFLDGYGFERATAEVLNKHQFNAVVTPGSGDGGVDIQVTRNGLRGVVQCKAHMASVGPAVVRDLYGVIHHTRASFGIIVSLGGFTTGAVEFARDKPILFVDLDDLIAMQEGRGVLAEAFASSGKA